MNGYVFYIIREYRFRYLSTALGISLCVLLLFFLISLYNGVSYGSVEYVRSGRTDLWVLQEHSSNILRSTSILPFSYMQSLKRINGVNSVSPVFFLLCSVKLNNRNASMYLTGFDQAAEEGGPPEIIKGRGILSDREIVIDKAFASKYGLEIGDVIQIRHDSQEVSGISGGTNMFVIQYAFVSLRKSWDIAGIPNFVSAFRLCTDKGCDLASVESEIKNQCKNVSVFREKQFIRNNTEEMRHGIIPLLLVVTLISAVVLAAILSLILSISIIEKRRDFAIMKALGCPRYFILKLVLRLSASLAAGGLLCGILAYFPVVSIISNISPEIETRSSLYQIILISSGVLVISILSSLWSSAKIKRIYPLEAFKY